MISKMLNSLLGRSEYQLLWNGDNLNMEHRVLWVKGYQATKTRFLQRVCLVGNLLGISYWGKLEPIKWWQLMVSKWVNPDRGKAAIPIRKSYITSICNSIFNPQPIWSIFKWELKVQTISLNLLYPTNQAVIKLLLEVLPVIITKWVIRAIATPWLCWTQSFKALLIHKIKACMPRA